MERIEFGGWPNCLRLANDEIELVTTTDVGPRVIRLAFIGGRNLFKTFDETLGLSGGSEWRIYGGHRLWHAPEVYPRTYAPDNGPVGHEWDGETLTLHALELENGLEKAMALTLDPSAPRVMVRHRITNHGPWAVELAPWSVSVMAQGGRAIFPHEDYQPHPQSLKPVRPVVLWSYTDMSDPRWCWGRRYIQLSQDPTAPSAQKAGLLNTHGWAAYVLAGDALITRFPYVAGARYPDYGCNVETFTNSDMLEIETLGPVSWIEPGGHIDHEEIWQLQHVGVTESEADIDAWIAGYELGSDGRFAEAGSSPTPSAPTPCGSSTLPPMRPSEASRSGGTSTSSRRAAASPASGAGKVST
jgi:hypothetical protein